ncbi:MAG: response regulator, partial [Candidatus Aminicenantes bacterium]|nr:response regulator [Candidatus Aminicenantes bacterium]
MKEKKVLIVDFDEESLLSISDLVNEEGFRAVTATDGLAGYEKFKAEDYDLVILEPMLPRLHGFELCKKIIQDPARKIPIIVVTGIYREPSCKMEAIQVYGASAYFTKPWSKEELRAKMLELLAAARETPARVPEPRTEPSPIAASPPQEVPAPRKSPRELKTSQDLDEVEKELRAAVAGIISPVPKKEVREKKEHRKGLDLEVEAILKRTIDELGLEETKKRPAAARHEPAVKPAPPLRPALAPRPDPWKDEPRASVAEEIKKGISARETSTNNIPATSSRAFEAEKEPFGIDRTLL